MASLLSMRLAFVTLVVGCAADSTSIEPFVSNNKADGNDIKLKKKDDYKLRVDEPSDLAFVDDNLYTVGDAQSKIYAITKKGEVEDVIDIEGNDIEALAYDPERGELLVADEASGKIWRLDFDGERIHDIEIKDTEDGNSGIEGLAFDHRNHLFVAKEKNPARIFELDKDFEQIEKTKIDWAEDLSALAWNPNDNHLYALSDADQALFRLDGDLDVDTAWKLPVKRPEGLAFYEDRIYIASDSEERLYVFEFDED